MSDFHKKVLNKALPEVVQTMVADVFHNDEKLIRRCSHQLFNTVTKIIQLLRCDRSHFWKKKQDYTSFGKRTVRCPASEVWRPQSLLNDIWAYPWTFTDHSEHEANIHVTASKSRKSSLHYSAWRFFVTSVMYLCTGSVNVCAAKKNSIGFRFTPQHAWKDTIWHSFLYVVSEYGKLVSLSIALNGTMLLNVLHCE